MRTTTFSADDAFSSSVLAAETEAGTKSDLLPFLSSHRISAAEGAGRPRFPGDEGGVTATAQAGSGAQTAGPPFVGVFGAEGIFFRLSLSFFGGWGKKTKVKRIRLGSNKCLGSFVEKGRVASAREGRKGEEKW